MGQEPISLGSDGAGAPGLPFLAPRVPLAVRLSAWKQSKPLWPLVFGLTLFVSAALLFSIQPMYAKMVLPRLGGTPATWITCLLFFQSALLVGYAYAHWSTSWLGTRRQPVLHAVLLAAALAVIPVAIPRGWDPQSADSPVLWLLGLLVVSVGLPFFVVSATAPLLQRWFAATRHPSAPDPYFLYRASNVGSLLALLAYPAVIEPRLRLAEQARAWAVGYGILVVLTAVCALAPRRTAPNADDDARSASMDAPGALESPPPPITTARRARWLALAFVPSSFMLAATTYVTTEIAAVPLVWVAFLAIYLLSFVVVFSRTPFTFMGLTGLLQLVLVLELAFLVLLRATQPVLLVVVTILLALFLSAVICHGCLAADRPHESQLTEFYLWIALGGALGGVFNALVAPVLFNSIVEYPLAIVGACLLRPPPGDETAPSGLRREDLVVPLCIGMLTVAIEALGVAGGFGTVAAEGVAFAVGLAACAVVYSRPLRFGLAVGAVFLASAVPVGTQKQTLYANRTFFGVLRVERDGEANLNLLVHGTTLHGAQSLDPARRLEPLTYYDHTGPVGDIFADLQAPQAASDVAVIGLGTGTLACYGRAGQRWTFYEIDPAVEHIARDPRLFTYLRDCPPSSEVVLGDGRLSLSRTAGHRFGVVVMDAFNSDSVPVHLLTREALRLYLDHLTDDGVIVVNVTNRYLDLRPVVAQLARDAGLAAVVRDDMSTTERDAASAKTGSMWVAMARRPAVLDGLTSNPKWQALSVRPGTRVWTDDFSNLIDALRR